MRWAECVAGVGVKICTVQDLMGKLKETDNLGDLGIDGRILNWMLKKQNGGGRRRLDPYT